MDTPKGTHTNVLWLRGPHGLFDHSRLPRERRHEPFTPRLPEFLLDHPTAVGILLAGTGIAGTWVIVDGMPDWPDWAMIPSAVLGILCMLVMMLGLGIVVVRVLEPVLGTMDLDWNAEPLEAIGMPFALQRKCERLGYWTAEDLARSIDRGSFPWSEFAYAERKLIEQSAHMWKAGSEQQTQQRRRRGARRRERCND